MATRMLMITYYTPAKPGLISIRGSAFDQEEPQSFTNVQEALDALAEKEWVVSQMTAASEGKSAVHKILLTRTVKSSE